MGNYWTMGYWFAVGRASTGDPERSSLFAAYCQRRRDEYEAGGVTFLPCIPDMWEEFVASE